MTEVTGFFQSMFIFNNFAPVSATGYEVKLAVDLKYEAQQLAAIADQEMQNGRTTQTLALEATGKEKVRIFTEISVWHNGRAGEKYRQAAARFEEAGKVYTKKSRAFNAKAEQMRRRAAEAEAVLNCLNHSLSQN